MKPEQYPIKSNGCGGVCDAQHRTLPAATVVAELNRIPAFEAEIAALKSQIGRLKQDLREAQAARRE